MFTIHKKIATLILALLISPGTSAIELPMQQIVPGGVALLPISTPANTAPPRAHYNGKPVMVVQNQNQWYAVVGVPLGTEPGEQQITVIQGNGNHTQTFAVSDKAYETQRLIIKDTRKVEPNPQDLQRISREKVLSDRALSHWNDTLLTPNLQLDLPVEGRLSSSFGLRRFFNDQPRAPHSGLDIAAPEGTPIRSPAEGRVLLTGDLFFNGNSVYIDHGQGLVTMYCHLNRIDVKEGQLLKRGEVIGTIGMTGRATGPHLHWGVSLNDARVNPSLFVPALMNSAP